MRVLGIDPGFGRMGVAIVEGDHHRFKALMHDCIETSSKLPFAERLLMLHDVVCRLIKEYAPDCMGLEKLFFFKNQKTAMEVAQVRGMLIALSATHHLALKEFTPLQVKQTLVGYGRADKQQVQKMVQTVFKFKSAPKLDDAADALAIAWCALQWKNF